MASSEQIIVHLPPEAISIARARVASGEFASESEVITEALLDSVLPRYEDVDQPFLTECGQRYDRARKDPSTSLTLDEAFQGLTEQ